MPRMLRGVVSLLNRLIHLDYDAIEAYAAALARVAGDDDKERLSHFATEHKRHIEQLALVVRNLGGSPPGHGDLRQALARGKAVLGGLSGERAVLQAMLDNEDEIARIYEDAATQPGVPRDVHAAIEQALCDERQHREWIARRLDVAPPTANAPVT